MRVLNSEKTLEEIGRVNHLRVLIDDLAKAARDFVSYADDLEDVGEKTVSLSPLISFARAGSSGKSRKESAMILTIKPEIQEPAVNTL